MTTPAGPLAPPPPDPRVLPTPGGILFFDGECGLCHRLVRFLARRDRHRRLRFAPLAGATAAALLPPGEFARLDTVILRSDDRLLERSTAAIAAISALGGAWSLIRVLAVVPRPLRDGMYDWVARHRGRWFGREATCFVPTAREAAAFLP